MFVSEILAKIRVLIDTDLTDDQLIGQMNELSKQLFRKFPMPDEICRFETTSIPYYELPPDLSEDRVRCVVIDEIEYTKVAPETQSPPGYFCTVFVGHIYLSPNIEGKDAYLYYRPRPITLSDTEQEPNFPEDYHDLYVYDGAKLAAIAQRDTDLVNNFQGEFDDIMKDAQRHLKKMGMRRAKETIMW
jgi:hypothetical protein